MVSKYKSKSGKDIFFIAEPASFPAPSVEVHMKMIFEIRDLNYATPATATRAGIVCHLVAGGFSRNLATLRLQLPCGERREREGS